MVPINLPLAIPRLLPWLEPKFLRVAIMYERLGYPAERLPTKHWIAPKFQTAGKVALQPATIDRRGYPLVLRHIDFDGTRNEQVPSSFNELGH